MFTSVFHCILKENPIMFAPLLMLYSNKEQQAVTYLGQVTQQPRKDPVKRLSAV